MPQLHMHALAVKVGASCEQDPVLLQEASYYFSYNLDMFLPGHMQTARAYKLQTRGTSSFADATVATATPARRIPGDHKTALECGRECPWWLSSHGS